jgi:hypothetical protein
MSQNDRQTAGGQPSPGYHYACGAFRRIAEGQYGQDRRVDLSAYEEWPDQQEVIDSMVIHGWTDEEAGAAVADLWEVLQA